MKIVATIEARMTSSRLPGKVLMHLGNVPLLEVLIHRVKKSKLIDEIVLATTTNKTDDPIVNLCKKLKVPFYRGSEYDVLDRVLKAAKKSGADLICELMGDSPFLDPNLIDETIKTHIKNKNDYTSNFYPENYLPMGFATQVFSTKVLEKTARLTSDPIDRVHVSYYIYQHPEIFKCGGVKIGKGIKYPEIRLCVDTKEDFDLVNKVFEGLGKKNPLFSCREAMVYLQSHPHLLKINKHVKQKKPSEG